MSWYGTHPILSKEEARTLAPKGACKFCIYLTRVDGHAHRVKSGCTRCSSPPGYRFMHVEGKLVLIEYRRPF